MIPDWGNSLVTLLSSSKLGRVVLHYLVHIQTPFNLYASGSSSYSSTVFTLARPNVIICNFSASLPYEKYYVHVLPQRRGDSAVSVSQLTTMHPTVTYIPIPWPS